MPDKETTSMPYITTAELVAANKAALADGTLIAMNDPEGDTVFRRSDGCVCALGAVIPTEHLHWLADKAYSYDETNVRFEDERVAGQTLRLHDDWYMGGRTLIRWLDDLPDRARQFLEANRGEPVNRALFEGWLEALS